MYAQSRLSPRPWIGGLQLVTSGGEEWVACLAMRRCVGCSEALTIKEMLAAERVSCLRRYPAPLVLYCSIALISSSRHRRSSGRGSSSRSSPPRWRPLPRPRLPPPLLQLPLPLLLLRSTTATTTTTCG